MNDIPAPSPVASSVTQSQTQNLSDTLLRVAWLSILLGLAIEVILLVIATGAGKLPGIQSIAADLTQKISWSMIICVGLAFGKAASKGQPSWMALAGLVSAPIAFNVARTLHKSVSFALKAAEPGAGAGFPFLIAGVKGLEYAALGMLLGWVGKRANAGVSAYAGVGLLVGIVFGGLIVGLLAPAEFDVIKALPQLINEVLFPLGCSLALFAADAIGKRTAS